LADGFGNLSGHTNNEGIKMKDSTKQAFKNRMPWEYPVHKFNGEIRVGVDDVGFLFEDGVIVSVNYFNGRDEYVDSAIDEWEGDEIAMRQAHMEAFEIWSEQPCTTQ
jgi:hypothetical protein